MGNRIKKPYQDMVLIDFYERFPDDQACAELGIHSDLWFFGCYFPGDTVAKREKGMLGTTLGLTAAFTACIHADPVTLRELKA